MEVALSTVVKGLLKPSHDVTILLAEQTEDPYWEYELPVIHLGTEASTSSVPLNISFRTQIIALTTYLKKRSPVDFIICLGTFGIEIANTAVSFANSSAKVLSWLHLPWHVYGKSIDCLGRADGHLAISKGIYEDIKRNYANTPTKLVYNPVSFLDTHNIPRSKKPTFVYIGRLDISVKKVDTILQAFTRIHELDWHLLVIGDGTDANELKLFAHKAGIDDKITWFGWKREPWSCIDDCTALLLSSESEAFGLVLVEALSRGVPVISSDCDYGPREIVLHDHNGWLFPVGQVEKLAAILKSIIYRHVSLPEPETCRSSVHRFAAERVIPDFEGALVELSGSLDSAFK